MKKNVFICYPKCSTCKRAEQWLKERKADYTLRDIVTDRPTEEEIARWRRESDLPLKRFFNTSGLKYKELRLKERLPDMPEEEQIRLLSTDGMLVKRPILLTERGVYPGFKPEEWEKLL